MSVVVMPFVVRMSYTISTTQLDIEHDQKSPRTRSHSDTIKEEVNNQVSTKNDTTITKSDKNHIKVGSSMILNMQNAYPISRTTCCDLLIKGYLREYHNHIFKTLPMDIIPLLRKYLDPILKWCLETTEHRILLRHKHEYHLYLNKNDWKSLTISSKYIIHDVLLEEKHNKKDHYNTYTISILNDSHIGSNLNDIQWLCQIISTNNYLYKLQISNCKHLLQFNKFHFLLQNSFLKMFSHDIIYDKLEEISIDTYKHFNDECFKILIDVIDKKCPSLTHLKLFRTDITNQSVEFIIKFLNENITHPLWYIDIEFCTKINDNALKILCTYLSNNPMKKIYIKCTGNTLFPEQIWQDQRLSLSIYPT
eukprot:224905_1